MAKHFANHDDSHDSDLSYQAGHFSASQETANRNAIPAPSEVPSEEPPSAMFIPQGSPGSGSAKGKGSRRHRHGSRRHRARRRALACVAVVLLLLLGACGVFGFRLYSSAMTARARINSVIDTASSLASDDMVAALANMGSSVESIQADAAAAKEEVNSPLWSFAVKLPVVGEDLASVQSAAGVLDDFAQTSLPQLESVADTLLNAQFSDGNGGLSLDPIITVAGQLTAVNDTLAGQAETLSALPESKIPQIQSALDKGKAKFAKLTETVDSLTGLVNMMPSFLGSAGLRTYVLLAQTNAEIRSSGGLCGSIGSFTAEYGSINVGDFHADAEFVGDVANLIGTNEETLWSGLGYGYYVHNISSSPDFPQVAQMAAQFWQQQDFGTDTVDGVMSLDPVALGALLDVTGPVTLSDGRVLDSGNAASFLLNDVYVSMDSSETDSYFAETAAQVVSQTFSDMSSSKLVALAKCMLSLAGDRHVYFWSFHDEDTEVLRKAGVTHEITDDAANPVVGMYLNEMSASKIDYYNKRTVSVERLSEDSLGGRYHITVTFSNTLDPAAVSSLPAYITANTPTGALHDDVVLFTPAGGTISDITCDGVGFTEIEAYNRTCYKGFISIEPGESVTLEWNVTTSAGAAPLVFDQTPTNSTDNGITYTYELS